MFQAARALSTLWKVLLRSLSPKISLDDLGRWEPSHELRFVLLGESMRYPAGSNLRYFQINFCWLKQLVKLIVDCTLSWIILGLIGIRSYMDRSANNMRVRLRAFIKRRRLV